MQLFKWCHAPIIHYIFHDGPFSNWGFLDLINSADLQIYAIELTSRQEVRFRETFFQNELKKCSIRWFWFRPSRSHWTDLQLLKMGKYENSKTKMCSEYHTG